MASMAWPGSLAWSMAKSSDGIVGSACVFGGGWRTVDGTLHGGVCCVSHVLQFCLSHEALRDVGW